MIIIKSSQDLRILKGRINRAIHRALNESAKQVANDVHSHAISMLQNKAKEYTGQLAAAMSVKPGSSNTGTFFRYDIVVDTNAAPYAMWVEFGRLASEGLPYSRNGAKNYSNSSFSGYEFLTGAIRDEAQTSIIGTIIGNKLKEEISRMKF